MKKIILLTCCSLIVFTASCSNEASQSEVTEAEKTAETQTNIEAINFDELELGAKIVGPLGPEVKANLEGTDVMAGSAVSYVACPSTMEECNPKTAPESTIFTFVHTIYPGSKSDVSENTNIKIAKSASSFFMNKPSVGFTGVSGYSFSQAEAALGSKGKVIITCNDNALNWSIDNADNDWESGEPITFFWKSTLPPKGPDIAYTLTTDLVEGLGKGPYPDPERGDASKCD